MLLCGLFESLQMWPFYTPPTEGSACNATECYDASSRVAVFLRFSTNFDFLCVLHVFSHVFVLLFCYVLD